MMKKKHDAAIYLKRICFIMLFTLLVIQCLGTRNNVFAEIPNDNPASFAVRRYVKKMEMNRDIKYVSVLYLNSDGIPDIGYAETWPNGIFGSGFCCAYSDGNTSNWPVSARDINTWNYYYYEKTGIVVAISDQEESYIKYNDPGEQGETLFMKKGDIYYRRNKEDHIFYSIPSADFEKQLRELTGGKQRTKVNWMANTKDNRNALLREYAPFLFDIVKPTLLSVSAPTSSTIRIEWNTIPNVTGYRVYKKVGDNAWQFLRETVKSFYIDPFVTPGNTYSYTVEACIWDDGKMFRSGYDPTGLTITIPAMPTPTPVPSEKTTIVRMWIE